MQLSIVSCLPNGWFKVFVVALVPTSPLLDPDKALDDRECGERALHLSTFMWPEVQKVER